MVKAYTLSDKIVQQGYNDVETVVGMVFKRLEGGNCEASSVEELQDSGATPINVGQVTAYVTDDSEVYDTYATVFEIVNEPSDSSLLTRVTSPWTGAYDQYIVVRRLDTFPIIDPSALGAPVGICYKIVVDAYTTPIAP